MNSDDIGLNRHGRVVTVRTPTGMLQMIRPVAEQLFKNGVISGSLDGELHAADAATVKAAVMTTGVCDFCSAPGPSHVFDVPDFQMPHHAGKSIEGWAACDECAELVRTDKAAALLERSIARMAFGKFTRPAIKELHARFWAAMNLKVDVAASAAALADYINDTLPPDVGQPSVLQRDKRIERVMRMTGLSKVQIDQVINGDLDQQAVDTLAVFSKQFPMRSGSVRDVTRQLVDGPVKPLPDIVPHWQRALDARFEAMTLLRSALAAADTSMFMPDSVNLKDTAAVRKLAERSKLAAQFRDMGFEQDLKLLPIAQTYSFNAETAAAIREAAQSLPHDAPLSSIETPNTGAGWFWFADPRPDVPVNTDPVAALLWGWGEAPTGYVEVSFDEEFVAKLSPETNAWMREVHGATHGFWTAPAAAIRTIAAELKAAGVSIEMLDKKTRTLTSPALQFSAYVVHQTSTDPNKRPIWDHGQLLPSTRWHWPIDMSFNDMLAANRAAYRASYGEGGQMLSPGLSIAGEEATMAATSELSLFFLMACLWFKQTVGRKTRPPVLTQEPGVIERHTRRRYMREHKLKEPPTVQVVALRKSARVAADSAETGQQGERATREYHCRWIVQGHPRLQPCGPGRMDKKLIWIEAHPAGPADKPLRTRERVFAVVR